MEDIRNEIAQLKKEKNAIILAHYYQEENIQDIADFVGDSLELSRKAAENTSDIIVFAGVHFMAETAKILCPDKKVLLPDLDAGCSLAESCQPKEFSAFRAKYPDHAVVTYINCSAEIKALSDLVCTSSNAELVISTIPAETPIIFAPDKNLGKYLVKKTGREMLLWDGACVVHEAFSIEKLLALYKEHPNSKIVAHPEAEEHILDVASFIGSTSQLLKHVNENQSEEFIVATEAGILHKMQEANPSTNLWAAPAQEDNTCACSECGYMKVNTMEKLRDCLKHETPEIILDDDLCVKARKPIERMLRIS